MFVFDKEDYNHDLTKKRLNEIGIIKYPGHEKIEMKISGLELGAVLRNTNGKIERYNYLNLVTGEVTSEKTENIFFGKDHISDIRNSMPIIITDNFTFYLALAKDFRMVFLEDKNDLESMLTEIKKIKNKNISKTTVINLTENVLKDDSKAIKLIKEKGYDFLPNSEIRKDNKAKLYQKGPKENPDKFIKAISYIVLMSKARNNSYISLSSIVDKADEASKSGMNTKIKTTIDGFEFAFGKISIIGGEPGVGKTSLIVSQEADYLSKEGYDVNLFSFEMSSLDLAYKSISRYTLLCGGLSYAKTHGEISSVYDYIDEWNDEDKRVYEMAKLETKVSSSQISMHSDDIYIGAEDKKQRMLDIDSFEKVAKERYESGARNTVFIVDYLQITPPTKDYINSNTTEYMNAAMRKLKKIANIYNVAVIVLSSLNKDALSKKNEPLRGFRGSYRIGFATDFAAIIQYDDNATNDKEAVAFRNKEKEKPFRRIRINILKNRFGSAEPIKLIYCAPYSYFYQNKTQAIEHGLYFPINENKYSTIEEYKNSIRDKNIKNQDSDDNEEELPF